MPDALAQDAKMQRAATAVKIGFNDEVIEPC
jgi:hypothetical protein